MARKDEPSVRERFHQFFAKYTSSSKGPDKAVARRTHFRLRVSALIVIAMASIIGIRLVDLQIVRADAYAQVAIDFRSRTYALQSKRGDILDSKGAVLATSVERYNVRVDQTVIDNFQNWVEIGDTGEYELDGTGAAAAAEILAPILEMDQAELGGLLMGGEKKSMWQLVKSDISPDLWRQIDALGITGIHPEQYVEREYPNGAVAGNILGYIGESSESTTKVGQAGIEKQFNSLLAGVDGEVSVELGPSGTILPQAGRKETPAIDGGSVTLTIDRDLQAVAQQALEDSVRKNNAEWGTAVIVEIGTGRILAMADTGTPDPSNLAASDPEDWGSRAVSAIVEPGSSGKLVTFSAVIDQGKVTPLDTFFVPSRITMPNGESIKDNNPHPEEDMTVAGILAKSYNTGLIQIGDKITDETRYDYMLKFGLGQKTGIEMPAEEAGILTNYTNWDSRSHYTTMFGQAWAATTLQLAQIGATLGNGGVRVPLHIVDGTTDANGTYTPTVLGESTQVVSAETAQTMLNMMQAVTQDGSTGYWARIKGYNVAGKTGTAQVPDANGNLTKRVGTFIGLVPAEDPQIAMAVVVYDGAGSGYGGDTAAPVFGDVGEFVVRQLNIPPSTVELYKYPWVPSEMK